MGCFLACFGSIDAKRKKPHNKTLSRQRSHGSYSPLKKPISVEPSITELTIPTVREAREKNENQSFNVQKKVTFDLTVKTYSDESFNGDSKYLSETDSNKESDDEREEIVTGSQSVTSSEECSTTSTTGSYPATHRYQNCQSSDDEDDDSICDEEDESDQEDDAEREDDEEFFDSDQTFESYNPSIRSDITQLIRKENVTKPISDSLIEEPTNQISSRARDRSRYVHPVLNPVENLSEWKTLKAKETKKAPLFKQSKENAKLDNEEVFIPFSSEPTFKLPKPQIQLNSETSFKLQKQTPRQEMAVDTSLSNWLNPLETLNPRKPGNGESKLSDIKPTQEVKSSPSSVKSVRYTDERPILGALTVENIKQASSPRKSPSRSPDEMPILGTVGTYWNQETLEKNLRSRIPISSTEGIPNTTSKYKEDKRVNWHSTPFEVRLERALNRGDPEAYSSYPPTVY
ncbi:hypothetical protein AMTRI_Chr07g75920 [Amborella trichopoda]|uniref:Uncharacterized protein n=1 Tax=Amborella trichopoda TaxID=13333 RepID=U5DEU4_AMBTC|nr:eisosome protein SEG2 [Amborella trichopoda]ERN18938.1 hypothetical protein AMTR_s00067p00189180 [Amborella trichopoda]|eukprot:XP_006857471.1 eisosome protein SEG2 [Amborella trichopoda]